MNLKRDGLFHITSALYWNIKLKMNESNCTLSGPREESFSVLVFLLMSEDFWTGLKMWRRCIWRQWRSEFDRRNMTSGVLLSVRVWCVCPQDEGKRSPWIRSPWTLYLNGSFAWGDFIWNYQTFWMVCLFYKGQMEQWFRDMAEWKLNCFIFFKNNGNEKINQGKM